MEMCTLQILTPQSLFVIMLLYHQLKPSIVVVSRSI